MLHFREAIKADLPTLIKMLADDQLAMGIMKQYRGQGLGNQFLSCVLTKTWNIGLKHIALEVFSNNTAAINLYKKHSFEIEGIKRNACFMNGEYIDIISMAQLKNF